MRHRRWIGAGATLALVIGLAGSVRSDDGAAASAAIRVFQFQPSALEVRAGTRVTWTNRTRSLTP
jgi:plastocyanin